MYTTQRTEISRQTLETLQPFSNWLRFAEFRSDDDETPNLLKCEDKELSVKLQPVLKELDPLREGFFYTVWRVVGDTPVTIHKMDNSMFFLPICARDGYKSQDELLVPGWIGQSGGGLLDIRPGWIGHSGGPHGHGGMMMVNPGIDVLMLRRGRRSGRQRARERARSYIWLEAPAMGRG